MTLPRRPRRESRRPESNRLGMHPDATCFRENSDTLCKIGQAQSEGSARLKDASAHLKIDPHGRAR